MGTRINPGLFDRYHDAMPDEPMFVLLARDESAPHLVQLWSDMRENLISLGACPESDIHLVEEATECAKTMELWRKNNDGKWREPRPKELSPKYPKLPKRVRHLKRGTEYDVLGIAEVQCSGVLEYTQEGSELVVYRGEDGKLWCRPRDEFLDGRFEVIRPIKLTLTSPEEYEMVTEPDGSVWYSSSYVEVLQKLITKLLK